MDESAELSRFNREFADLNENERNTVVRREIADQQNKHFQKKGQDPDPIAVKLIEHAEKQGPLLIRYLRDPSGNRDAIVEDEEHTQRFIEWLSSEQVVVSVLESANKIDPGGELKEGVKSLFEKLGHSKRTEQNGGKYIPRFYEYTYVRLTKESQDAFEAVVNNLIKNIMSEHEAATIIVKGKNIDVFDSYGKGVRLLNPYDPRYDDFRKEGDEPFVAFIDSAAYCLPNRGQSKQSVVSKSLYENSKGH